MQKSFTKANKSLRGIDTSTQILANKVHWTFTSLAAMILITPAIFLVAILIWRKCCQNNEQTMPVPSVPPMLILVARPINKPTKSNMFITISISISWKEQRYIEMIFNLKNKKTTFVNFIRAR
jgi:hypothetical protein